MPNNKFLVFLLVSLVLTAFLVGYLLVGNGVKTTNRQNTGTLLDRFEGGSGNSTDYDSTSPETPKPEIVNKKFLSLNPSISAFAFSLDNTRVAYFIYQKNKNGGFGTVFVSNSDGSNPQILLKTRVPAVTLSWTEKNEIAVEIDPLKEPIVLRVTSD